MSGGHYQYKYYKLHELADCIERDFLKDGKYMEEDWSNLNSLGKHDVIEKDRLSDATPEQKEIILDEIKNLIKDLRNCAKRSKELEWYMSGDTGAKTYLERLKEKDV